MYKTQKYAVSVDKIEVCFDKESACHKFFDKNLRQKNYEKSEPTRPIFSTHRLCIYFL